jgi:hypothetical protein
MSVSVPNSLVCWALILVLPVSLLGQSPQAETPAVPTGSGAAVLHTQGGVWVNGYEAHDSSAVFTGDLIETKPGFSANLSLEGSSVVIQPQSVAKFQGDSIDLDYGGLLVGTSKRLKVKVNCITIVPVQNERTQYEVADLSGTVEVVDHKNDVNVEREEHHGKLAPQSFHVTTVREGQQSFKESEVCQAVRKSPAGAPALNPYWIAGGAAGAGVLVWILVHGGGGKTPISNSQP